MKILIVTYSDSKGGAAKAAYRLHKSLKTKRIKSYMLVVNKETQDSTVLTISWQKKIVSKIISVFNPIPLIFYKKKSNFSSSFLSNSSLIKTINKFKPDVVHLHWINAGMLRIEDLEKINAPLVWSLHDMWPFTGGCHYSYNCNSFKTNCGHCPELKSNKINDVSRKQFKRKKEVINQLRSIKIIGLSRWIQTTAKDSKLFKNLDVINLPNPIDTKIFKPKKKEISKKQLGFSKDKKYILFGAMSSTSDRRKGFFELIKALKNIETKNIELVIFGNTKPFDSKLLMYKTHYLGHIESVKSLINLYNAVELVVVPSLAENLSNVIMESISCGTPVVAFNIGGNNDLIDHKKNGYLAEINKKNDLARGIDWVLNHSNYDALAQETRKKAEVFFDAEKVAVQYKQLYIKIIDEYKRV